MGTTTAGAMVEAWVFDGGGGVGVEDVVGADVGAAMALEAVVRRLLRLSSCWVATVVKIAIEKLLDEAAALGEGLVVGVSSVINRSVGDAEEDAEEDAAAMENVEEDAAAEELDEDDEDEATPDPLAPRLPLSIIGN